MKDIRSHKDKRPGGSSIFWGANQLEVIAIKTGSVDEHRVYFSVWSEPVKKFENISSLSAHS